MKEDKITKEQFLDYENVRKSGVTNMFNIKNVMFISDLTREECVDIMKNYNTYKKKYGETK